jgi:hypothetical protein
MKGESLNKNKWDVVTDWFAIHGLMGGLAVGAFLIVLFVLGSL